MINSTRKHYMGANYQSGDLGTQYSAASHYVRDRYGSWAGARRVLAGAPLVLASPAAEIDLDAHAGRHAADRATRIAAHLEVDIRQLRAMQHLEGSQHRRAHDRGQRDHRAGAPSTFSDVVHANHDRPARSLRVDRRRDGPVLASIVWMSLASTPSRAAAGRSISKCRVVRWASPCVATS